MTLRRRIAYDTTLRVPSPRRPTAPPPAWLLAAALATACAEPGADTHEDTDATLAEIALPRVDACDAVRSWPEDRSVREQRLLAAIADARDDGGRCPDGRRFAPQAIPATEGALVCAARNLAVTLATVDDFGHVDGDEATFVDRLADAQWTSTLATELVAAGDVEPEVVVDDIWRGSAPHCAALHAAAWTRVGVAVVEREVPDPADDPEAPMSWGAYWVVVLSAEPTQAPTQAPD